jgi:hypothetical protein
MDKAPGELSSLAGDDSSLQSEHRAPRFGEEVLISSSEVPRDEEGEGLTLVIPQVTEARALFSSQDVVETTGLKDNSDDLLNLGNNDTFFTNMASGKMQGGIGDREGDSALSESSHMGSLSTIKEATSSNSKNRAEMLMGKTEERVSQLYHPETSQKKDNSNAESWGANQSGDTRWAPKHLVNSNVPYYGKEVRHKGRRVEKLMTGFPHPRRAAEEAIDLEMLGAEDFEESESSSLGSSQDKERQDLYKATLFKELEKVYVDIERVYHEDQKKVFKKREGLQYGVRVDSVRDKVMEDLAEGAPMRLLVLTKEEIEIAQLGDFEMARAALTTIEGSVSRNRALYNQLREEDFSKEAILPLVERILAVFDALDDELVQMLGNENRAYNMVREMKGLHRSLLRVINGEKLLEGEKYLPRGAARQKLVVFLNRLVAPLEELLRVRRVKYHSMGLLAVLLQDHPHLQGMTADEERREAERLKQAKTFPPLKQREFVRTYGDHLPVKEEPPDEGHEEIDEMDDDARSSLTTVTTVTGGELDITFVLRQDMMEMKKQYSFQDAFVETILVGVGDNPMFRWRQLSPPNRENTIAQRYSKATLEWDSGTPFNWKKFFRKLDLSCDLHNFSCMQRIIFFLYTAGLKTTAVPDIRKAILNRGLKTGQRLGYDYNRVAESDFVYWCRMYQRVKVDIARHFWTPPNETAIAIELEAKLENFEFEKNTTLNSAFETVSNLYEELLVWQEDTGSVRKNSPFHLFDQLKNRLREMEEMGIQVVRIMDRYLQSLVLNPLKQLPKLHGLSEEEVLELKGKSPSDVSEEIYCLMLKDLAEEGKHDRIQVVTLDPSELQAAHNKNKRKATSLVNAAVIDTTTSMSPAPTSGKDKDVRNWLCDNCGMGCGVEGEDRTCRIEKGGKIHVDKILEMRSAIWKPDSGGPWKIGNPMLEKLKKWGYSRLKLDDAGAKELRQAIQRAIDQRYEASKSKDSSAKVGASSKQRFVGVATSTVPKKSEKEKELEKKMARQEKLILKLRQQAKLAAETGEVEDEDDLSDDEEK